MMKYLFLAILWFVQTKVSAQLFQEVSNEKGINYIFPGSDNQEVGAGLTVFDVNGDGWDDIFQTGGIFASKLWLNEKGKFVDATEQFQLNFLEKRYIQGAVAADFNNDGYEDLFIANQGKAKNNGDNLPALLLQNVRGKYFKPVFEETFSELGNYTAGVWGDINNDGFVDLYVLNYVLDMETGRDENDIPSYYIPSCMPNKIYVNQGGKGFKEMSQSLKLDDDGCGLAAAFTDFDNDGDMDLMLLNDFGHFNQKGNRLYRNNYPEFTFTEISKELGFYEEFYGMGVGTGDYNNDGRLDYFLTNIGGNYFFEGGESGFTEKALLLGLDNFLVQDSLTGTSWSGLFFDAENDGDLDLFVAKGYLSSLEKVIVLDANKFYINNGNSTFSDESESYGLNDTLAQRGAAILDFDHDGDLDIATSALKMSRSDFAKTDQKVKLHENNIPTDNNWIGFKLMGGDSVNRSCLGCRVRFQIGDKIYLREVEGGSGHSSQSTKILYFGLGKNEWVENIEIQWLGSEITRIKKLNSGHVYTLNRKGKIKKLY